MGEDILKILSNVDKEVYWAESLNNIEEEVKKYQDKLKNNRNDAERYLQQILPTYWTVFHTHNIYRRRHGELLKRGENDETCLPQYDIGIFLVGFSTLPIVLSLAEIQPIKQVYFLYSDDTIDMLDEINNRISAMLPESPLSGLVSTSVNKDSGFALNVRSPSDPIDTFKQIKTIIHEVEKKFGSKTDIALDLTGGKKTMIGGGFTAGSIYSISPKCDMYYVDSLEYDPRRGSPKPGYEFLSRLENPYNVYNVQSVREAEKLFNQHNYEAAAVLWEGVDQKLNDYAKHYELNDEQNSAQKYLFMADCYGCWDAFDYIAANNSKEDNGNLWDYNTEHTYSLNTANIDVLEVLSKVEDPKTLFDEEARIIHYTIDRYQNGVRRMESDRFDDAIVRFTQVVEILCRYHVYKIAVDQCLTDERHNLVSSECCLDEEWSVTKLIHFLFKRRWSYDYRYHIGNEDWRLDIDKYGYKNTMEVIKLIRPRNDFVHVKSNPKWEEMEDNAKDLQKLAQKFLENFSCDYRCETGLSFNELLELHKFRRIED